MSQIKIPEELYHCFEAAGYLQSYEPNEDIYLQGEDASRIYFIKKGRVRAYYITTGGRELTFEIIEKGRIFGESSFLTQCARPVCVAAVTPVELMACDLNQLYAYMEKSAKLMQLMLQLLSNTCNHLTAQLRRITLYDRYQRIASLLLSETQHPDFDRGVTASSIPYTQEDLALILNLNRVTVNRVLQEWKKLQVVAVSYGRITILNRTYLQPLFCIPKLSQVPPQ